MTGASIPLPGAQATDASDGLVLAPFRGVRFDPGRVSDLAAVTSPPYDVVDADGVHQLEVADPHNVVRLILPRTDDCGPEGRYRHAAALLGAWLDDGTLVPDDGPALYVYEQATPTSRQRGLVGALGLRDYDAGVVLPHEGVMEMPVLDRLALMRETEANLEPILLVYDGDGRASDIVDDMAGREPLLRARTPDGVTHRLWRVTDAAPLAAVGDDLRGRQALIADGHHRYATYLRLQAERRAAGAGPGPWDYGLAMLVDSARYPLDVAAIHRLVPDLGPDEAVRMAGKGFAVAPLTGGTQEALAALAAARAHGPAFAVGGPGGWHLLTDPDRDLLARSVSPEHSTRLQRLDATVLHSVLLESLWGVPADDRAVTYHHDADAAVRAAGRTGGTAVLLNPVTVEDVLAISAAGDKMPRKSTSFGPKPRTGLVLRSFLVD